MFQPKPFCLCSTIFYLSFNHIVSVYLIEWCVISIQVITNEWTYTPNTFCKTRASAFTVKRISSGIQNPLQIFSSVAIRSSSNPEKSYFVTSDTCECPGFKNFHKFHHGKGLKANCSHLEAVRLFKERML